MGFGSKMCREGGMMGKRSLELGACHGAEAVGEKVESSLFLSPQGQLHRGCLLTSIAP